MPVKRRATTSKVVVQEEEQDEADVVEQEEGDESGESSDGEDDSDGPEIEMLAKSRERRGNAGAKMAQLLDKEDPDEFYQSTYGGFFDEGEDNDYQSPTQSDSDQVDSDFDKSESDDEPVSDTEDATKPKRRKQTHVGVYREPKLRPSTGESVKTPRTKREPRKELPAPIIEKKFRWSTLQKSQMSDEARKKIKARFLVQGGPGAHRHKEYTQEEMLAEAKITEDMNKKSLEKYEQFELEQKRKRDRAMKRRVIDGPKIRTLSLTLPIPPADVRPGEPALCSRTFIEFPDEHSLQKHLSAASGTRPARMRRGDTRCCVTGQPAKYRDPVTGLPYATTEAFKQLRQKYETFLLEKADANDAAVAAWVSWRQSASAAT
uniref:Vacuolar protein sorting-associated protein 72 homolog n=1 Tax=Plectus sambesii TaxID=2011161 RepID=A0A914VZT8_9BILA